MGIKLAVIYYSATGTTHRLAKAMAAAGEAEGAEVRLRRAAELAPREAIEENERWAAHLDATRDVGEASVDDLAWADAFLFGSPTRFGLPAAQLKQFLDQAGPLWQEGALVDKVGSSFTSASTAHGGQETTILALNNTFYHWGSIVVPPGYAEPVQFEAGNPYGTSFVSGDDGRDPDEVALRAARFQAERVVRVAARLRAGERHARMN